MRKRFLSMLIAVAMVLTLLPVSAFAVEGVLPAQNDSGTRDSGVGEVTAFAPLPDELRWQSGTAITQPASLTGTVNGTEIEVPVTWSPDRAMNTPGLYILLAQPSGGYTLKQGVEQPKITAILQADKRARVAIKDGFIEIPSEAILRELAELVNTASTSTPDQSQLTVLLNGMEPKFRLVSNIRISGDNDNDPANGNWVQIGISSYPFNGTFDGGNYIISGISLKGGQNTKQGLFGYVGANGTIKNLIVNDVDIAIMDNSFAGGVAGYSEGTIENCYSTGTASANGSISAGVVGWNKGIVKNCYSTVSVSASGTSTNAGGVVGYNEGTVKNCYHIGSVRGDSSMIGGIVGNNSGTVESCYSAGSTAGNSTAGGIAGYNDGTITNCVALNETVTGSSSKAGRIAGDITSKSVLTGNLAWSHVKVGAAGSEAIVTNGAADNQNGLNITNLTTLDDKFSDKAIWTNFGNTTLPALKDVGQQTVDRPDYLLRLGSEGPFGSGDGSTADKAYEIRTEAQLRKLAGFVNAGTTPYADAGKFYKLTADIAINSDNDTDSSNGNFVPIGTADKPFQATFDGNGKTISGVTIYKEYSNAGLFGYATGATIKSLGVIGASMNSDGSAGGVVGYATGATKISNCFSTAVVTAKNDLGTGRAGGVVGYIESNTTIERCYSTATVTSSSDAGGVVGHASGSTFTVRNCAALNETVTGITTGRIVGSFSGTTLTNNIAWSGMKIGRASSEGIVTDGAATDKNGLNITDLTTELNATFTAADGWAACTDTTLPALGQPPVARPPYLKEGIFAGKGTEAEPYQISNEEDLRALAKLVNSATSPYADAGKFYELTANIVITGDNDTDPANGNWQPIGNTTSNRGFKGSFDGNGKTISGITVINNGSANVGLFGYAMGATIKNLGVTNVSITSHSNIGGVVGSAVHSTSSERDTTPSTISNCYSTGNIYGEGYVSAVGGVAGTVNGSLANCYSTVNITVKSASSYNHIGGVVGDILGGSPKIKNCYSTGSVTSNRGNVGGVVGFTQGTVTNCVSLAKAVSGPADTVGRVSGTSDNNTNCYAWSGMTVTDADSNEQTPTPGANKKDGANIGFTEYAKAAWWSGTAKANFTDATVWENADNMLPVLAGIYGQDGSLPFYLSNFKKPATVTVTTATNLLYDGTAKTATATAKNGDTPLTDSKFTFSYEGVAPTVYAASATAPTDAGKYKVTATLDNAKYEGEASKEFTITKKDTAVSITCAGKVYDGKTDATVTYKVDGKCGTDDVTATGKAAYDKADVGARTVTATDIKLEGKKAGNYNVTPTTATTTATITKATVPAAPIVTMNYAAETVNTVTTWEYSVDNGTTWKDCTAGMTFAQLGWNGKALSIQFRVKATAMQGASTATSATIAARPAAPAENSFAVTKPTAQGATDGKISGITSGMEYSTDNGATYKTGTGAVLTGIQDGTTVLIRTKATSTAPASSTVSVIVSTKQSAAITFANATVAYNGKVQLHENATTTATGGEFTYTYAAKDGSALTSGQPKNAGRYTVTATYSSNTHLGSKTVDFTITAQPLTVKAKSYSVSQNASLPTAELEYSGFVNGETAAVLAGEGFTANHTASNTSKTGTYSIAVAGSTTNINYVVTKQNGTLTVIGSDDPTPPESNVLPETPDKPIEKPAIVGKPTDDSTVLIMETSDLSAADTGAITDRLQGNNLLAGESTPEFYEVELYVVSKDGKDKRKATPKDIKEGKVAVMFPYPSGTSADTHTFVIIHFVGGKNGKMDRLTTSVHPGLQSVSATVSSFSPFAVVATPKKTAPTGGVNNSYTSNDNSEYEFWMNVKQSIENAHSGDVVDVTPRSYDKMPWSVMEALRKNSGVSLVISWNNTTITIPAGKALKDEAERIYWPLSLLEERYAGVVKNTSPAEKPAEQMNPTTGGPVQVAAGAIASAAPESKAAPATGNTIVVKAPELSQSVSAPEALREAAITPPGAGFEVDAFAGTPDAVAARGTSAAAIAGFTILLAVLCGGGLWFWKRRLQR